MKCIVLLSTTPIRCICYTDTTISEIQRIYEFRPLSSVLCNVSHLLYRNIVAHVKKGASWSWIAATHVGNERTTEKTFRTHPQKVACEAQSAHDDSSYQVKERVGSSLCEVLSCDVG